MLFFFVPFLYFYKTRLRSIIKLISWGVIYLVPIFLSTFSFANIDYYFISYFVVLTLTYNLYEIGYIQNDTETIKKEHNPTLRLSRDELVFYNNHRVYIYFVRLFISFVLTIALAFFVYDKINAILVWSILLIFFFYNHVRSRLNLAIHFLLVVFRFVFPVYVITSNVMLLFIMIFIFPVPNLIERTSEEKFGFLKLNKTIRPNISFFRVVYYFFLSLFMGIICIIYNNHNELKTGFYISIFFFIYRLVILFSKFLAREKNA